MKNLRLFCLFCLPLKYLVVTSPFGFRVHPVTGIYSFHDGVDLRADHDTVFVVSDGRVAECGYNPVAGIFLKIDHHNWQSCYDHLAIPLVTRGDSVSAGYPIAISGATGRVTGPHPHFGIRSGGRPVDPLKFIYELLIRTEHE